MTTSVKELIARAKAAQKIIEYWPQEKVDEMVAAVGWAGYKAENAQACAKLAVEETGMGVYEAKLLKHQKKTLGTLRDLDGVKTCGIIEEIPEKGLYKIAKPVGVIGALIPVTNPTATPPGNALSMIKTRNAVIFAPHPRSKLCTNLACEHLREGLRTVGAPEDLIQCIKEPSQEAAQELMAGVDMINATGGGAMVKVAYSSGTPAYGVGAGNAAVIVDETADLADAAKKIFLGKTFDHATSCSSENSLIIQEGIWNDLLAELKAHGGYLCNDEEKRKLEKFMWPSEGKGLNIEVVAQHPKKIAKAAGINAPDDVKFIMVLGSTPGSEDKFTGEKLSIVLTLWKYKEFDEAIEYIHKISNFCGRGHSCGIHSTDNARILKLAEAVRISRITVRQSVSYANSGNYDNGLPFTLTLGCGTWGGNSVSENVTWKHFLNKTWVSIPIEPIIPNEEKIFGAYWKKYGK